MSKESQSIEWKESWHDEYLKWICGFANAQGGVLHIGRNDKGVVVGLPNARKLLEDIPNKVRDILGILVCVNLKAEGGKEYLEIVVEPYLNAVSYKGEYHLRVGSTKQELKGAALSQFLLRKYGRTWDSVPVPHATFRELSSSAFAEFRRLAKDGQRMDAKALKGSTTSLLEKLHLVEGDHLTRAAVLLFHPDPEKFITGAFVKIGYFRTDTDILYHDEVHGDLFTQARQTADILITKYLRALISYRGIQRLETLPVPAAALREALLNALIHRNYAVGAPVQIRVYPDKLKIWNPGELPDRWTAADLLRDHSSHPFNPSLANAFFRAGEIESWGRGIRRIVEACREAGTPKPKFRYRPGDMWMEFPFPAEYVAALGDTRKPPVETGVKTGVKTSVETSVKTSVKILQLFEKHPEMTLADVARKIGKTLRAVELASSKLVKAGRLKHVGPQKGGHWEVIKG